MTKKILLVKMVLFGGLVLLKTDWMIHWNLVVVKLESLDGIHIYFADPWHKKRHHKRRLIQAQFVSLLVSRLKVDGYLHLATDWHNYAEQMLLVLNVEPSLQNTSGEMVSVETFSSEDVLKPEELSKELNEFKPTAEQLNSKHFYLAINANSDFKVLILLHFYECLAGILRLSIC